MPAITFSEEDIKAGSIVAADKQGWFTFEVGNTKEKPAKTDGSTVYTVALKVLDGPDTNMHGALVFKTYSEKALWRAKDFFLALGGEIKAGARFEFDDCKGMKLQGYLRKGKNSDNGEDTNEITNFRPVAV